MQILIVGNTSNLIELRRKFSSTHTYMLAESELEIVDYLKDTDIVFDFVPSIHSIGYYSNFQNTVFLNSSFTTLSALLSKHDTNHHNLMFGFCGLPTFVERDFFEVSLSSKLHEKHLSNVCSTLATDFVCVKDQVGFVTPRVICMIINEAYYTLEEGTATREDIDLAMKLGTNYPYGPFEWAKRIKINQVIKLLDAVYRTTKDERYKICTLLKSEIDN